MHLLFLEIRTKRERHLNPDENWTPADGNEYR